MQIVSKEIFLQTELLSVTLNYEEWKYILVDCFFATATAQSCILWSQLPLGNLLSLQQASDHDIRKFKVCFLR